MGPRKSNAFAAGKDDGAAAGKVRKVGGAGGGAGANTTGGGGTSSSHKHSTNAATGTALTADISYTNEERAFLESQLALFPGGKINGSGSPTNTACTDFARMTREQWFTGLPLLVSATEKLLQAAAEQYQLTCRDRAAAAAAAVTAAAASSTGGGGATAAAVGGGGGAPGGVGEGKHGSMLGSSGINGASGPDGTTAATAAAGTSAPRPTPAAGTPAQFAEENAYIIAQAQQLQWYPFTYQRWVELLLEPGRYHTARDDGRLRGDAIQTSLRRCILVTHPAVEGSDVM